MNIPPHFEKLKRAWVVYLVHHSHTDIGYTDTQGRIRQYHLSYLDELLQRYEVWKSGDNSLDGFVWTSECFWSVEQWLGSRPESLQAKLAEAIRDGFVALSASYLHCNELIDFPLMSAMLKRARSFADRNKLTLDTALHADINGYSWGYSQALVDQGITGMVNFLHSYHGFPPIGQTQIPFWWETPKGERLLVWNGEHYMLGNALGLVPGALANYIFKDEMTAAPGDPHNIPIAEKRLPRYLHQLEQDGYPQPFIVAGVHGSYSDNAPPHFGIPVFIQEWNKRYGERIRLEMTSPSCFLQKVRQHWQNIPVYRGDWPDWWSDGLAGSPKAVSFYREAKRGYERLQQASGVLQQPLLESSQEVIESELALFCEHTFSHSDSMKTPWEVSTQLIAAEKQAIASGVLARVQGLTDELCRELGELPMRPLRPHVYRLVNPYPYAVEGLTKLYLEYCDFHVRDICPQVRRLETDAVLEVQREEAPRGWYFNVQVSLEAGEALDLVLVEGNPTAQYESPLPNDRIINPEGKSDVRMATTRAGADLQGYETPYLALRLDPARGITRWKDPETQLNWLLEDLPYGPFTPVYEYTPVAERNDGVEQVRVRTMMGRNRKGENVERHVGVLKNVRLIAEGPHYCSYEFDYDLPGTRMAIVELKLMRNSPRAEVTLRLNKDSIWEPENLYLSLPFETASGAQLYLDKAGAVVRPSEDQIPGTQTDWYCLQNGYAVCAESGGLAVACLDAPLLQLGPLDFGVRELANEGQPQRYARNAHSWLMTNYWETNFDASLGGFHAFRYRLQWGAQLSDPMHALEICRRLQEECLVFRAEPR